MLAFHLNDLRHAVLAMNRRDGRLIIYTANFDTMNALLTLNGPLRDCPMKSQYKPITRRESHDRESETEQPGKLGGRRNIRDRLCFFYGRSGGSCGSAAAIELRSGCRGGKFREHQGPHGSGQTRDHGTPKEAARPALRSE